LGKTASLSARGYGNGTPFRNVSIEQIAEELHGLGYHRYGNERLINGMTGNMMEGTVFIGPTFYQRLKHMVKDKQHARSRGPVQILTRQPVEGRSRDGGLRFGEMERDWCALPLQKHTRCPSRVTAATRQCTNFEFRSVISHGAAAVLRERLFEQSDVNTSIICSKCGFMAQHRSSTASVRHGTDYCKFCDTGDFCREVKIPFAFKLLLQEMLAINLAPRICI
jgi:DNA-directed RNA polymerase II subunit RPB2